MRRAANRQSTIHLGKGRGVRMCRLWMGKTLTDHQADRAAVVREALAAAGIVMPDADRLSATSTDAEGRPRFVWMPVDPNWVDPATFRQAVLLSVEQRRRWRSQYDAAKAQLVGNVSATGPPADGGEAA